MTARRPLAAVVLAAATVTGAAAEGPEVLTLADALERVDRASPDLAAASEAAAAQEARAQASARGAWPRLVLSSDWSSTDTPARVFSGRLNRGQFRAEDFALERLNDPGPLSHLMTVTALDVPIDAFGKVASRAGGERAAARASGERTRELRLDLRLRAVEAFHRARLAGAAVAVAEGALRGARAREDDVAARVEQGAALGADRLRVRARRRQREAAVAEARERLRVARAALARAVGAPAGTELEPGGAPAAPEALEGTLAEWQARALAERPAIAAAREDRAAAELAAKAERRSLLPDLRAFAQLEDDRGASASARSYAVGAALRWDLFDPARTARSAAAEAASRAAGSAERAAGDQVRLEVESAWRRAQSARERHAAASGGAEEGREALRVVQERRRSGMATLTDELETEAAALAAELDELVTAAEIDMADAALRRAAGGL